MTMPVTSETHSPPPPYVADSTQDDARNEETGKHITYEETEEVPVLIIGQSMVGMALSALLAYHG